MILFGASCNSLTNNQSSFWQLQKSEFKYKNKREFISDSILRAEYKTLKKFSHPLFENIPSNPVYLYSWQDRVSDKNEFTVVKDDGELGLKILYFILDKQDSLISSTQIAGKGNEGGYWFETKSRFINNDSIINIGAVTKWLDFEKRQKLTKTRGDSTFSYFVIEKNGQMTEKIFNEVKEINFDE